MWFFVVTSIAVGTYLLRRIVQRQPFNLLWLLLFAQQGSMIYTWYPMNRWNALVIFVLVSWFAVEAFGWATNLLSDDVRVRGQLRWLPYEVGARPVRVAKVSAGQFTASRESPPEAPVTEKTIHCDCAAARSSESLIVSSWKERLIMVITALSMGYMFYGMELMVMAFMSPAS